MSKEEIFEQSNNLLVYQGIWFVVVVTVIGVLTYITTTGE